VRLLVLFTRNMNRMYENKNILYIVPLMKHTVVVCVSSINPMAIGCFIYANINRIIVLVDISMFSLLQSLAVF
jgi:hypothetical protein